MLHKRLSIKMSLVVLLVSIIMITGMRLFHAVFVVRDLVSVTEALGRFLIIISVLTTAAVLVVYFLGRPLEDCIKKIEDGFSPGETELQRARKIMITIPYIVIAVNIGGFFIGPVIQIGISAISNHENFFTSVTILTIIYNVAIGLVAALAEIFFINIILTAPKELMKIHSIEQITGKKDFSVRGKNLILPLATAFLACSLLFIAGYTAYREEVYLPAAILEKTAAGETLTAAEDEYLADLAALVEYTRAETATDSPRAAESINRWQEKQQVKESGFMISFLIFLIILFAVIIAVTFAYSVENDKQVKSMLGRLRSIVSGDDDLTKRLCVIHFNEYGELTSYINAFIQLLYDLIMNIQIVVSNIATSSSALNELVSDIADSVENINRQSGEVNQNTSSQAVIVDNTQQVVMQILEYIKKITANQESQTGSIKNSALSINKMTDNINFINNIVAEANQVSENLARLSGASMEKLESTIETMASLKKSSSFVSEIVEVISGIASQTNLLAMNAAIEAAHAGDSGRGFAVVADEIRKLAEESAASANTIISQIKGMEELIRDSAIHTDITEKSLVQISGGIHKNAENINNIFQTLNQQQAEAGQILTTVDHLVKMSEEIKVFSTKQMEKSIDIDVLLQNLTSSTDQIRQSVESQDLDNRKLSGITRKIREVSNNNLETVNQLKSIVAQFKL